MIAILFYTYFSFFILASILFLVLSHMFYQEKEFEGMRKAILLSFLMLFSGLLFYLIHLDFTVYLISVLLLISILVFLYPFKKNNHLTDDTPVEKYNERDIMFSRKELVPGSTKYEAYYQKYPEREKLDNLFRAEPGLLSPKASLYHENAFAAAKGYFGKIEPLHEYVEGNKNPQQTHLSVKEFTTLIKNRTKELGALEVGITATKAYHFYSHKGRRNEYGNEIKISHKFAIAFTVEMSEDNVAAAPKASIVAESAKQYWNAGVIATQIAELIRTFGYDARPHIDGNYQVVCPLVARDAGLGEIGRMGLLMTKNHGPRVRIGIITTELELIPDKYRKDHSMIDFCRMCKKCATCCPSQSIPSDDPKLHDGVKRWKIDSESCFTFWCKVGTDCGRCMAVCPYSHPNHSLHKVIRWGIRHSKAFRFLAVFMDDYFYGKKPESKEIPKEFN